MRHNRYTYYFGIIILALLITGCGTNKQNPIASIASAVMYIPGIALSIPNSIISGNPSNTKDMIVNGYKDIIGEPYVHTPIVKTGSSNSSYSSYDQGKPSCNSINCGNFYSNPSKPSVIYTPY